MGVSRISETVEVTATALTLDALPTCLAIGSGEPRNVQLAVNLLF